MREIKFRVWDGECLYYQEKQGEDFNFQMGVNGMILEIAEQCFEIGSGVAVEYRRYVEIEGAVFTQYTGLKDKNGTDIYESDIVLAHDSCGKYSGAIEWWNDRWVLRFPGSDGTPQNQSLMTVRKPKVIGNIYENPDLLSEPVSNPYKLD